MEYKCGVTGPNTPLSILLGIQLTYELDMQSQVAHLEGDMISRILERFLFLDLKHLSAFLFMVPEKVSKTFKNDFCESLELVQRWAERMWPQLPRVPHCLPISTALTALSLDSLSRFQEVPKRFQRGSKEVQASTILNSQPVFLFCLCYQDLNWTKRQAVETQRRPWTCAGQDLSGRSEGRASSNGPKFHCSDKSKNHIFSCLKTEFN